MAIESPHAGRRHRLHHRGLSLAVSLALGAGVLVAGLGAEAAPAHAAAGADPVFTAGDVVVYRVGDGSGALSGSGSPVSLDEYSPTGGSLASVTLPTSASSAGNPLAASGSASSEGGLTLSADGRYLVATGYDAAVGTSGLSSSAAASLPRTVATVDASGDVNSTTALTDFSDGNNPRSAVSADGSEFWVGGAAGGVRYATLGATTSTSLVASTYKNVRQLEIVDGQLYTSADPTKAGVTLATVGSGLPTSGSNAVTNLPFASAGSAPVEPYAYSLLTLGSGTAPDTLYVADDSLGEVVKYGLVGGDWVQEGSVTVPNVTGLAADDTDGSGTVTVYATGSGSNGTSGTLYKITDASGIGGALSGSASVIAAAGANEAFRGVAFAPGTKIGSGGGSAPSNPSAPTIATAYSGLPAAQNDLTNPTLPVTVGDSDFPADQLTVTAASSNTSVAPQSGIVVGGTGADRTLSVTPGTVGYSTITLTVTAPDGSSAVTQVQYGVSAYLGDAGQRYFSGAGNGSSAIDVGDGYMIVGDDSTNVLHLYNETQSGPPVASYDFTSQLPDGTTSVDIEASARVGDLIYWTGSMTNSSSGDAAPSRSTLFAAKVTGSGASTQLTYVGSYTGLKDDLIDWDENDGSGLGANHFGFAASAAGGVDSHDANALDVEGMEFAPGSSTTAYLAFRAPLEPTSARNLALMVPVTNIDQLVTGAATTATFGAPVQFNLGGLGIRDIRKNADGQYLIIAGTPDGTNSDFQLYTWDGNPADPPLESGAPLPLEPAGANQGSWETVVSVPDPLVSGAPVQLLEDDGDTAWYGDTLTSKAGLDASLQKDLGQVFTYQAGSPLVTSTTLTSTPASAVTGQQVTYTATVAGPSNTPQSATGTVEFQNAGTDIPGCSAQPLTGTGMATCTVSYPAIGAQTVTAHYAGDPSFAASSSAATVAVAKDATVTTVTSSAAQAAYSSVLTVQAQVAAAAPGSGTPTGKIAFSVVSGGKSQPLQCSGASTPGTEALAAGIAECAVNTKSFAAPDGTYTITASYNGDANYLAGSGTLQQQVARIASTTTLTGIPKAVFQGGVALITVSVAAGAGAPIPGVPPLAGAITVTVTNALGTKMAAPCVLVPGLGGVCVIPPGELTAAQGPYTVTANYAGDGTYAPSTATTTITVTGPRL